MGLGDIAFGRAQILGEGKESAKEAIWVLLDERF